MSQDNGAARPTCPWISALLETENTGSASVRASDRRRIGTGSTGSGNAPRLPAPGATSACSWKTPVMTTRTASAATLRTSSTTRFKGERGYSRGPETRPAFRVGVRGLVRALPAARRDTTRGRKAGHHEDEPLPPTAWRPRSTAVRCASRPPAAQTTKPQRQRRLKRDNAWV